MQDPGYELPRIPIPRTSVNKARRERAKAGRTLALRSSVQSQVAGSESPVAGKRLNPANLGPNPGRYPASPRHDN